MLDTSAVPIMFMCPWLHSAISKLQFEIDPFTKFVACTIAPDLMNETLLIKRLVTSIKSDDSINMIAPVEPAKLLITIWEIVIIELKIIKNALLSNIIPSSCTVQFIPNREDSEIWIMNLFSFPPVFWKKLVFCIVTCVFEAFIIWEFFKLN